MGKIVEIFGVEHDESQKERGDRWSEDVGRKSSSCIINVHLTSEECKAPKILRSSCTPRRHCERWFWILCSIYWTRIISITNDSGKSHGYHVQIARLRRRSSGRSICAQTTPQMTRFRDVKVCKILVTDEIDDHRIQSDYKYTNGLQNPEGKNSALGIAYAWWNRATRRTTPLTTWPPRTRDARVIPRGQSSVVRFWSSWFAHHIVAQGSSCARLSCHPCM